jgi:hypothetical protein
MSQELVKRLRAIGIHMGNAIAGYRDKDFKRAAAGLAEAAWAASEAADLIEKTDGSRAALPYDQSVRR